MKKEQYKETKVLDQYHFLLLARILLVTNALASIMLTVNLFIVAIKVDKSDVITISILSVAVLILLIGAYSPHVILDHVKTNPVESEKSCLLEEQ